MKHRLLLSIGRIGYWFLVPVFIAVFPKTTRTRVVVVQGKSVLLVRTWISNGKWDLPGGGVKRGETLKGAILRELYEETGITLSQRNVYLQDRYSIGSLVRFQVALYRTHFKQKPPLLLQKTEIAEAIWVPSSKLKNYQLLPGLQQAIKDCLKQ